MCADTDLLQIFFALAGVFVSKETPASVQPRRAEQHSTSVFPLLRQLDGTPIQNLRNVPKAFKVQARGVCAR